MCAAHLQGQLDAGEALEEASLCCYSDKQQGAPMILGGAVFAWAVVHPDDCASLENQRDRVHPCQLP